MAIGLTVVSLLSGCSRQVSDTASSPEGGGTTSSEPIKQYIASVIKDNDDPRATYPMTKAQREILKRSEAAGGVSSTDYELAWSHYKQCVVDKGYSTPVLDRYPNGLYFVARINAEGMTDELANIMVMHLRHWQAVERHFDADEHVESAWIPWKQLRDTHITASNSEIAILHEQIRRMRQQ